MPPLKNQRHELFAQAIAKGKTADEAYTLAGFRANRGNAVRLKANENVSARVAEIGAPLIKRTEMTVEKLLTELAIIAGADMKEFADWGNEALLTEEQCRILEEVAIEVPHNKRVRGLDREALRYLEANGAPVDWRTVDFKPSNKLGDISRAVQSIGETQNGVSLKLHDKLKAIELYGKYLKMFADRVELTGANGSPIEVSTDAREKLAAAIAKVAGKPSRAKRG